MRKDRTWSRVTLTAKPYFDQTQSVSISIFHASLGENARLGRRARNLAGDRYWSALIAEVDTMIQQAVWAGFGYFQREAGSREIRRMHDSGDCNVAEIAALFSVSRPTVYRSLDRTTALPPLPAGTRPVPDVAEYDQLLTRNPRQQ